MNEQNLEIIERVRKLLSMAVDTSSPHEAAIAASRARKLMDKHQIDLADLIDESTGFGFKYAAALELCRILAVTQVFDIQQVSCKDRRRL